MSWITWGAVFFISWWVVLFATLPFSLRTQDDAGDVTLGTVPSAPTGPHMLRAVVRTTLITLLLFVVYWAAGEYLGLSISSIPEIVPKFD
ncbi:MAG: DUF1467 family protein [Mesorhizobium sp.]